MAKVATIHFAFELGDIVTMTAMHALNPAACAAFSVIERLSQECHGGTQRHYKLRPILAPDTWRKDRAVMGTVWTDSQLTEPELMPFPKESRAAYGFKADEEADEG